MLSNVRMYKYLLYLHSTSYNEEMHLRVKHSRVIVGCVVGWYHPGHAASGIGGRKGGKAASSHEWVAQYMHS
jgi:hypothetical protein